MYYQKIGLSRKLIHQLKYHGMSRLGRWFAYEIAERMEPKDIEAIVTIPLHPKKQRQRGYNQLHLLADTLSELWQVPHLPQALKRNFYSKPQAKKDQTHRKALTNLFSLDQPPEVQHLLVIDDVYTTGSTMKNAAEALLNGTDYQLSILVLAVDE